jgi:histone demethylase JARID1
VKFDNFGEFFQEYWRILDNIDEDVMVEYGADLHTMDHGSGFPTLTSKNLSKEDEVYAKVITSDHSDVN